MKELWNKIPSWMKWTLVPVVLLVAGYWLFRPVLRILGYFRPASRPTAGDSRTLSSPAAERERERIIEHAKEARDAIEEKYENAVEEINDKWGDE